MLGDALLFEHALKRVNFYLKFIGLGIDSEDSNRTVMERLRNRWCYCIHFMWLNTDVLGEILWFIVGLVNGTSTILENTFILPCITLCLLGNSKALCMVAYGHHINDLLATLRTLQSLEKQFVPLEYMLIKKRVSFLKTTNRCFIFFIGLGIIAFAVGPLAIMASIYYSTGEVKLRLPFLAWYPFNAFDICIWPFVYIHMIWSACVAGFSVYGPDSLYYTCCTFIRIQFSYLQWDFERVTMRNLSKCNKVNNDKFRAEFAELVNRHRKLIRCVELLEIIYSKPTLLNVVSSSMLICITGFNILAIEELPVMLPFVAFLFLGLLEIYLICYYGDTLAESSIQVSDAIYKSKWYKSNTTDMKAYLLVIMRAQKPCNLTACGFSKINLRTFTRILSTAWSYFAVLVTIYQR